MKGDFTMERYISNQKTGIQYTLVGDYYLPDFTLPDEGVCPIGVYGRRHGDYLKQNSRVFYTELLTSGKLHSYLADVDEQAREQLELIVKQMATQEGVIETLKAENQILWVQKMNSIRNRAAEIVIDETIYC